MDEKDTTGARALPLCISSTTACSQAASRVAVVSLLLLVVVSLGIKFSFWFRFPINQDEFLYLSNVHIHARGELTQAFQTIYVHLFSWLPWVSQNEVTQVLAARALTSVFFVGTCVCLFLIGRHLFGMPGALFSVLGYVSLLYTQYHGASFRSDTPAAFFSMLALCLFLVADKSRIDNVVAGVSLALACLFTIKAGIYMTLLALMVPVRLWSAGWSAKSLQYVVLLVVASAGSFAIIYGLQTTILSDSQTATHFTFLRYASSTWLTFGEFFPSWRFFLLTLYSDPLVWLLVLLGIGLCTLGLFTRRRDGAPVHLAYVAVMGTPLLSLLFYRNGYPYFYAFFMPPVTLLCGYAVYRFLSVLASCRGQPFVLAAVAVLGVLASHNSLVRHPGFSYQTRHVLDAQRELLGGIHKMFPEPVPYIDGCRMVSSFPNAGFVLSSVDMKDYLRAGRPVMMELLRHEKPVFLLANVPHLDLCHSKPPPSADGYAFLPEDWEALRANFVHHWGPVWILGKRLDIGSGDQVLSFEIPIAGRYTVETDSAVLIDGGPCRAGGIVWLATGTHSISATGANTTVTLRWGENCPRPHEEPAMADFFLGPFL